MTTGASPSATPADTQATALSPQQRILQPQLAGNNINETTFLATDYLNHLNEAVMMIELIPSMPDMLEDAKAWEPKSYLEHFKGGELCIADLACEAYEIAPERFRLPFDLTIKAIHRRITKTLETVEPLLEAGDNQKVGVVILESCKAIQDLIGVAGAIVNGSERVAECAGTPAAAEPAATEEEDEVTMSQDDIDALFD